MKIWMLFLPVLFYIPAFFSGDMQKTDLPQLRKDMLRAINSAVTTDSLYRNLQNDPHKTPLILAYMGALEALKAKNSWNPYNKIKYLNLSGKTLAKAVKESPDGMEIRFVRFSIQSHLPGFLGLNDDMTADKNMIVRQISQKNYGSADQEYVRSIIRFLLDSKQCTPEETSFLRERLTELK